MGASLAIVGAADTEVGVVPGKSPTELCVEAALLALADAYRQLGRDADASEQLQKVVQRFPNSKRLDEAYFRLGETAYAAEQFEQALDQYSRVVSQWPDGDFAPHAQYGLGWNVYWRAAAVTQKASSWKANFKHTDMPE